MYQQSSHSLTTCFLLASTLLFCSFPIAAMDSSEEESEEEIEQSAQEPAQRSDLRSFLHLQFEGARELLSFGASALRDGYMRATYRPGDLESAIHQNDVEAVRRMIAIGVDLEEGNPHNKPQMRPLFAAILGGRTAIVELLVRAGVDINKQKGDTGETALHCSVITVHADIIKLLLDNNADVNAKANLWNGGTPLNAACQCANTAAVKLILEKNPDVNTQALDGTTPLHQAAWKDDVTALGLLIRHGADLEARTSEGRTPLDFAIPRVKASKVLLLAGANIAAERTPGESILHHIVDAYLFLPFDMFPFCISFLTISELSATDINPLKKRLFTTSLILKRMRVPHDIIIQMLSWAPELRKDTAQILLYTLKKHPRCQLSFLARTEHIDSTAHCILQHHGPLLDSVHQHALDKPELANRPQYAAFFAPAEREVTILPKIRARIQTQIAENALARRSAQPLTSKVVELQM